MIVEDEPLSRLFLQNLLGSCPDIEVIGMAANEDEAVDAILEGQPGLVFMDIELQTGSGFGVVDRLGNRDPHIVFTTALDQRATNLLRLSGVPYIQKPIDLESLSLALQAARDSNHRPHHAAALMHLRSTLRNNRTPLSMLLPGSEDFAYVALQDIIAIEASGKESRIWHHSGDELTVPLELKELDDLLRDFGFFRPHMQYIVNRSQVRDIPSDNGDTVVMKNDRYIPVSPKKLAELRQYLGG